ncbi:MAG: hypothetical protein WEC75_00415 [Dehalococcoidia bacterium]
MWALITLFAILLPVLSLAVLAAAVATAIGMLRRRGIPDRFRFISVVHGYARLMMLVGIFVAASGAGLGLKAALGETFSYDVFYDSSPSSYDDFSSGQPEDPQEEDAVWGLTMLFLGVLMFTPHAAGLALLRARGNVPDLPVTRAYNLVGLATATIGSFAAWATALGITLQRAADDNATGWRDHHPGEPLIFAVILLALAGGFAYNLWSSLSLPEDPATFTPAADNK